MFAVSPAPLPSGRAWTKSICNGQEDPLPWVYIHSRVPGNDGSFLTSTSCFCTLKVPANVEIQVPTPYTLQPPTPYNHLHPTLGLFVARSQQNSCKTSNSKGTTGRSRILQRGGGGLCQRGGGARCMLNHLWFNYL